ncbi:MAG TPA: choice-of-anchor A family protein [Candidatus Paceibacterota bacterium]|nr:choice-of-anchor A family protein [Candidatus Paceibacterota bacterium]
MNLVGQSAIISPVMNLSKTTGWSVMPCLAVGSLALSLSASAETVNPFAVAEGFNIVVEHDFDLKSGHPEGAVAVGGNFSFQGGTQVSQMYAGSYVVPGETKGTGLIVGGSVNFPQGGQLNVGNHANVYIGGGSYNVHDWNSGETVINNSPNKDAYGRIITGTDQTAASIGRSTGFDFAKVSASFHQSSSEMAALAPTATGTTLGLNGPNKINPSGLGLHSGLNVIDLTGTQLNNIQNINWGGNMMPGANSTVIFNIDVQGASSFTLGSIAMGLQESQNASYVLFNFFNLSGDLILAGNEIIGSILAPDAHIKKYSDPKGQIFAEDFVFNGGEVHYWENKVTYTRTVSVPDVSSLWAEASALVGLIGLYRRSSK